MVSLAARGPIDTASSRGIRFSGQAACGSDGRESMRVLGIDYGDRRIGLAVSDGSGTLARPLRVVAPRGSLRERAAAVAAEVAGTAAEPDGLGLVVVGVPRALNGTPHRQTARALAFADALRAAAGVPIALQDERLTSVEAEQRLAVRERDWRKRKAKLDAAAAAVILQDYLDRAARDRGGLAATGSTVVESVDQEPAP